MNRKVKQIKNILDKALLVRMVKEQVEVVSTGDESKRATEDAQRFMNRVNELFVNILDDIDDIVEAGEKIVKGNAINQELARKIMVRIGLLKNLKNIVIDLTVKAKREL